MPFPNTVNYNWPKGFPGAWASENPRRSVLTWDGGLKAGVGGLTIAAFAWIQPDGLTVLFHITSLIQNIALALGIKAVFLALAMTGNATLWMAVFADVGASLLVVANGLRLRRWRG